MTQHNAAIGLCSPSKSTLELTPANRSVPCRLTAVSVVPNAASLAICLSCSPSPSDALPLSRAPSDTSSCSSCLFLFLISTPRPYTVNPFSPIVVLALASNITPRARSIYWNPRPFLVDLLLFLFNVCVTIHCSSILFGASLDPSAKTRSRRPPPVWSEPSRAECSVRRVAPMSVPQRRLLLTCLFHTSAHPQGDPTVQRGSGEHVGAHMAAWERHMALPMLANDTPHASALRSAPEQIGFSLSPVQLSPRPQRSNRSCRPYNPITSAPDSDGHDPFDSCYKLL